MKYTTLLIIFTLSLIALGAANAQDVSVAAAIETDTVEASTSTPGDLNSQRIRGAAALVAGCAANETYDTVTDEEVADCTAELAVADPAEEIDEVEASNEPVEDYPTKN